MLQNHPMGLLLKKSIIRKRCTNQSKRSKKKIGKKVHLVTKNAQKKKVKRVQKKLQTIRPAKIKSAKV